MNKEIFISRIIAEFDNMTQIDQNLYSIILRYLL